MAGFDLIDQAEQAQGPCDWCLTFSGMTKKGRACCELRALASMPKARRQEVYNKTMREDGTEAYKSLQAAVSAEYQRLVAFRAAKREGLVAGAKTALLRL
jgi:hypothetical protein